MSSLRTTDDFTSSEIPPLIIEEDFISSEIPPLIIAEDFTSSEMSHLIIAEDFTSSETSSDSCGQGADARPPAKEKPTMETRKRKLSDDDVEPAKKMRCSTSCEANPVVPVPIVSQAFGGSLSDRTIFELSSKANTSRDHFNNKYSELSLIGEGGFGSVYGGLRRVDNFPVAIKYVPFNAVKWEKVPCQGRTYNVIMEVALMLKAACGPGSDGQPAVVSLLDWYLLDQELILVMERPVDCMSLNQYLQSRGGSLTEHEAKSILKQLVDVALDMHSKGVFHRDIKLHNVLVETSSGQPRVYVIDFGVSTFSSSMSYRTFSGTHKYFPPEWSDVQTYWAHPTTVWQLGALFYSLLSGHKGFSTRDYITRKIAVNRALSKDVKSLLYMCLDRNPLDRASLQDLQLHPALEQLTPPPV